MKKKYGNEVLKLIRERLHGLYRQHIKGKRKLMEEYGTIENRDDFNHWEEIGHVNKDTRLLWALSELFYKQFLDFVGSSPRVMKEVEIQNPQKVYREMQYIAIFCLHTLCFELFWLVILGRFSSLPKNEFLFIKNNWSIFRVADEDKQKDWTEEQKPLRVGEGILTLIKVQIDVINFAAYASRACRVVGK
ncbi:MAG: hypothetical protein V1711_02995 [bacterium]